MKLKSFWGFLPICCLLALPLSAQHSLNLGSDSAEFGTNAEIELTLNTTGEVQGLVATFDWDGAAGTGVDLVTGAAIADADTVVTRVEGDYMVIGVVMDSDGQDEEIILPGEGLLVATAIIQCASSDGEEPIGPNAVEFRDDTYNTVDGGPLLDNIIVIGGRSLAAGEEGMELNNGEFTCTPTPPSFSVSGSNPEDGSSDCGDAVVTMQNLAPVEGYVVALCHDSAALTLQSISVGSAASAVGAEFEASEIVPGSGGTLGVVLDFEPPFDGQTIPPGEGHAIAVYNYCCNELPEEGSVESTLSFCDMTLGTPAKENVIVVGGLSIGASEGLELNDGTFTCNADEGVTPPNETDCEDGIDNDKDGLIDGDDPDCQKGFACGDDVIEVAGEESQQASLGGQVEVCLHLKSPEDGERGHDQPDHIQGFVMAISYCCDLSLNEESLDITGTMLEALGAEFISVVADNSGDDGDGCEAIVGVLVDALPPFDGATIPPLADYQRMGCLTFDVTDDSAACGTCCSIEFTDGINGPNKVPVKNIVTGAETSFQVASASFGCEVCIVGEERFYRGDCNFSQDPMGMAVDISDAAAVVSFLFLPGSWKFNPPCVDACDCNDDGRVDLADAICVLQYYLQGGAFPPAPGPGLAEGEGGLEFPGQGVDPTEDKLDCVGGTACHDA